MSESGWLSLATAIISAISAGFVLFLNFKYGKLADRTEHVIKQNDTAQDTIDEVKGSQHNLKREMDGRLTEYRRLVEQKAVVEVAAALVAGEARGIAKERERTKTSASAVVELAKQVAEEVIATAEQKAKDK